MAKELSLAEQLCYITTRIETVDFQNVTYTGTGFFVSLKINESTSMPLLITNKHVVENMQKITIHLTEQDKDGNPIDGHYINIEINDIASKFIYHPNKDIDLCMMPIRSTIIEKEESTGRKTFYKTFTNDMFITESNCEEVDAIENIIMVGYPIGLWDKQNNRPIFRQGITATDPKVNYNGKNEFLIDCACINGSSGSPVLIFNKGIYSNKFGKETKYDGMRFKLLGIQYQIPLKKETGEIVVINTPTSLKPAPIFGLPINLGYVIKAQNILDFIPIIQEIYNL